MASEGGEVKRCTAHGGVLCVDLCPSPDEHFGHRSVAHEGGISQRANALGVPAVHIGAGLDEESRRFALASQEGFLKRRSAAFAPGAGQPGIRLEDGFERRHVPFFRRLEDRLRAWRTGTRDGSAQNKQEDFGFIHDQSP